MELRIGGEDKIVGLDFFNQYYRYDRLIPTGSGYFAVINDEFDNKTDVLVYDSEWNKLGSFSFSANDKLAFLGECGLVTAYQYFADETSPSYIISRFNIGEFEIVPKREILPGDANLDDEVDITDVTTIQRLDARMIELSDTALRLADADQDGEVCIIDATWLQRYSVNMKAPDGIGKPINDP